MVHVLSTVFSMISLNLYCADPDIKKQFINLDQSIKTKKNNTTENNNLAATHKANKDRKNKSKSANVASFKKEMTSEIDASKFDTTKRNKLKANLAFWEKIIVKNETPNNGLACTFHNMHTEGINKILTDDEAMKEVNSINRELIESEPFKIMQSLKKMSESHNNYRFPHAQEAIKIMQHLCVELELYNILFKQNTVIKMPENHLLLPLCSQSPKQLKQLLELNGDRNLNPNRTRAFLLLQAYYAPDEQ